MVSSTLTSPAATWTFEAKRIFVPTGAKTKSGKARRIPVTIAKVLISDPLRCGGSGEFQITRCTRGGWLRYVITERPRTAELRWGSDGKPTTHYSVGDRYSVRVDALDRAGLIAWLTHVVGAADASAILHKLGG